MDCFSQLTLDRFHRRNHKRIGGIRPDLDHRKHIRKQGSSISHQKHYFDHGLPHDDHTRWTDAEVHQILPRRLQQASHASQLPSNLRGNQVILTSFDRRSVSLGKRRLQQGFEKTRLLQVLRRELLASLPHLELRLAQARHQHVQKDDEIQQSRRLLRRQLHSLSHAQRRPLQTRRVRLVSLAEGQREGLGSNDKRVGKRR